MASRFDGPSAMDLYSRGDPDFIGQPYTLGAGLGILAFMATLAFASRVFTKAYVMKQAHLEDCK